MNRGEWDLLKKKFQILQPSWKTTVVIVCDIAALVWAVKWINSGGMLYCVMGTFLLTGVLFHFYLLLHEATHSAVSRNRWLNDLVGHLCGWLILMPYLSRQRSHLLHHIWTGHPTGDPANHRLIQRFSVLTQDQADRLEWVWSSWIPLLSVNDRLGLWRDPFQKRRDGAISGRIDKEMHAAYLYWVGYALLAGLLLYTRTVGQFLTCYVPALIFLFCLEELANLPHHAETPLLDTVEKALPYWKQHTVTHSCRDIPIFSRFVLLNFNLHTAHHLFPWVPWNGLPQVHREIVQKLPHLVTLQEGLNELDWSMKNRKRPLLEIMGHYFDKIPKHSNPTLPLDQEIGLVQPYRAGEEEGFQKSSESQGPLI